MDIIISCKISAVFASLQRSNCIAVLCLLLWSFKDVKKESKLSSVKCIKLIFKNWSLIKCIKNNLYKIGNDIISCKISAVFASLQCSNYIAEQRLLLWSFKNVKKETKLSSVKCIKLIYKNWTLIKWIKNNLYKIGYNHIL